MIKHYTEICVVEVNTLIEAKQTDLVLVKVGDIIKDNIHNTYHMVESNGFSELVTFGREPRGLDISIWVFFNILTINTLYTKEITLWLRH